MLCALLLTAQTLSADQILDHAKKRIDTATTMQVTVERFVEEFPRPEKTRWWYRKGGYYRYENKQGVLIASPSKTWSIKPSEKGYKIFPGAQTDWSLSREIGIGIFGSRSTMPIKGTPKEVNWHGLKAIRIEIDGTKAMTKGTRLYYFFDPKTYDHIGTSANLGSVTQVVVYRDLKINPTIANSTFVFLPKKGWKLVKD